MNQIFLVLILSVMVLTGIVGTAMAYTLEVEVQTWSIVGKGQLCLWNFDGEKTCKQAKTNYKDKMVKDYLVNVKENYIGDGEIFQACVWLEEYYNTIDQIWQGCSVTRLNIDDAKVFIDLDAIELDKSQFSDARERFNDAKSYN